MLHKIKRKEGEIEIDLDDKHRYWLDGKQLSGGTKIAQRFASPSFGIAANWAGRCAGKRAEEILKKIMSGDAQLNELTLEKIIKSISNSHWAISSEAKEIGTLVHTALEKLIESRMRDDDEPPEAPFHRGAHAAYQSFLDWEQEAEPTYLGSEEVIYFRDPKTKNEYTGTLDVVFKLNGVICVGDFKTSKVFTEEMVAQVALYANAYEQCQGEKVTFIYIFRLPKIEGDKLEIINFRFTDKWRRFCRSMNELDHFQREIAQELKTQIKEIRKNAKS